MEINIEKLQNTEYTDLSLSCFHLTQNRNFRWLDLNKTYCRIVKLLVVFFSYQRLIQTNFLGMIKSITLTSSITNITDAIVRTVELKRSSKYCVNERKKKIIAKHLIFKWVRVAFSTWLPIVKINICHHFNLVPHTMIPLLIYRTQVDKPC